MQTFLTIFLTSAAVSALLTWVLTRLPHLLPDQANQRSSHTGIIPRSGGIAVIATVLVYAAVFLEASLSDIPSSKAAAALAAAVSFGILGLIDDYRSLPAKLRLVIQIILSFTISWAAGSDRIVLFGMVSLEGIWLYIFASLWITAAVNFFNFMDGIDGLASIQTICMALFAAYVLHADAEHLLLSLAPEEAIRQHRIYSDSVVLNLILAAAAIGFFFWNRPRAKIFMGDAGSYFLGSFFAVQALLFPLENTKSDSWISFTGQGWQPASDFSFFLLLLFPFLMDPLATLFLRWKDGKHLMDAHREHFYQLLNRFGYSVLRIDLIYFILNLILFMPVLLYMMNRSREMYLVLNLLNAALLGALFTAGSAHLRKVLQISKS